jgi:hypothetical protein
VHAPGGIRVVQLHRGFLHGQVVVVAHLGLAVLETALVGGALGEEQIGIGLARDLHPRIQARLEVGIQFGDRGLGAAGCRVLALRRRQGHRMLQPQLGQAGALVFLAHHDAAFHRLDAGQAGLGTDAFIEPGHAQGLRGRRAELAGGEDVTALERDVLAGRDRGDLHRRPELAQRRAAAQGEQHGDDEGRAADEAQARGSHTILLRGGATLAVGLSKRKIPGGRFGRGRRGRFSHSV